MRPWARATAIVVLAAAAFATAVRLPALPEPAAFTFFVASDSHFGAERMDEVNRDLVSQLNELPGTEYPPALGGQVETPRGLLFLGDATDNGHLDEFAQFEKVYGRDGRDGLLRFPVYEAIGNHDLNSTSPIKARVTERHGGINYAVDWEGVRFLCLDMCPDGKTLQWLRPELQRAGRRHPLVLFFHYSLAGPYSDFWEAEEKDDFGKAIEGYNVLAIFHGHEHRVGHYVWRGHPVFRPGAPRHFSHHFLVVRMGSRQMQVAARDFDTHRWVQTWTVPVRR
jgi:hypothetical protein